MSLVIWCYVLGHHSNLTEVFPAKPVLGLMLHLDSWHYVRIYKINVLYLQQRVELGLGGDGYYSDLTEVNCSARRASMDSHTGPISFDCVLLELPLNDDRNFFSPLKPFTLSPSGAHLL